jgi:hypothetical protein
MARGVSSRGETRAQFWQQQVAAQAASGLSIRGYCRRQRLRECSFYFWRKCLAGTGRKAKPAAFVPVRISRPAAAAGEPRTDGQEAEGRIEIVLTNRCQVKLIGPVDRQALADVLTVLGDRPC